jgi:hypothetical protein
MMQKDGWAKMLANLFFLLVLIVQFLMMALVPLCRLFGPVF